MADTPEDRKRLFSVILISVLLFAAVIGFFAGAAVPEQEPVRADPDRDVSAGTERPVTPIYRNMARSASPDAPEGVAAEILALQQEARQARAWPENQQGLAPSRVDLAARRKTQKARAERRAFRGAPPVIPHPAAGQGGQVCMTCHSASFRVGQIAVPEMSHPFYTQCTQCHAPSVQTMPAEMPRLVNLMAPNQFSGLRGPLVGNRAWAGPPPTMPHSGWMRTECIACHAPTGRDGLGSSHPWRSNCRQCHVPSAGLDQGPPTMPGLAPVGEAAVAPGFDPLSDHTDSPVQGSDQESRKP